MCVGGGDLNDGVAWTSPEYSLRKMRDDARRGDEASRVKSRRCHEGSPYRVVRKTACNKDGGWERRWKRIRTSL